LYQAVVGRVAATKRRRKTPTAGSGDQHKHLSPSGSISTLKGPITRLFRGRPRDGVEKFDSKERPYLSSPCPEVSTVKVVCLPFVKILLIIKEADLPGHDITPPDAPVVWRESWTKHGTYVGLWALWGRLSRHVRLSG
jgi:hypothetical protein